MTKIIPKKNKYKKAKWLSEEALQITVKRRETKSKGEKERYKHLNAEFQRIARRDKKEIKVHFKYLYWHRLNRLLEKKLPPRASFCHHSSATRPSVRATLIKRQTSRVYHLKHTNSLLLCVSLTFWLMAHICKLSMHSTKRAKNKETRIN